MNPLQIRECRLSNGNVAGHSSGVIPAKRSASRNPGLPAPGTSWIPALFAGDDGCEHIAILYHQSSILGATS